MVARALRTRGWTNSPFDETVWQINGFEVAVITVDEARGLKFEGVVVAEPADSPLNIGRHGPSAPPLRVRTINSQWCIRVHCRMGCAGSLVPLDAQGGRKHLINPGSGRAHLPPLTGELMVLPVSLRVTQRDTERCEPGPSRLHHADQPAAHRES